MTVVVRRSHDSRDARRQEVTMILCLDLCRGCYVSFHCRHAAPYSGDTSKFVIA